MSEQNYQSSAPLGLGVLANFENLDLTTVDTNYPILATGIYPFKISGAEVVATKDQKGQMLVLQLVTEAATKDKNGKEIPVGYKLTHRVGLTPTFEQVPDPNNPGQKINDLEKPKRTPEAIMRDVATVLDAVFGEEGRKRIQIAQFPIESLINQQVTCRTSIDPEKDGYPETARVSRFVKKETNVPSVPGV